MLKKKLLLPITLSLLLFFPSKFRPSFNKNKSFPMQKNTDDNSFSHTDTYNYNNLIISNKNNINNQNQSTENNKKMKKLLQANPKMKALIDSLRAEGVIKSDQVYNAMLHTDRGDYCPSGWAYYDSPQSIDYNATISAPHMHAYALEYLKDYLKPGNRALDVGSGSGYLTVAFSRMMEDKGISVGIEHIKELVELGKKNVSKNNQELIDEGKIVLVEGDGRKGYEPLAPYDCIHVGAAAPEIPEELVKQLNKGGRLMVPVGAEYDMQYVYLIDKDMEGNVEYNKLLPVRYVPLTSKEHQLKFFKKGSEL